MADALVVLDRRVQQAVALAPAAVPGVLGADRALALAEDLHREGVGADALDAHLGIRGAERDRDDAVVVGDGRRRRAHVVVAGYRHEVGALGDHLGRGLGALDGVGLGVGDHRPDRLAQDAARGVELLDRHHGALERWAIIGVHPAALGDREADHHLVVRGLDRSLQSQRDRRQRRQDLPCDSGPHLVPPGSLFPRPLVPTQTDHQSHRPTRL